MLIFVCKANVWRSQIAEWIAKYFWIKSTSCAWVEARKEKYFNKPDKQIIEILKKEYNIDISNQNIKYPEDIKELFIPENKIIFFFNPKNISQVDKEVLIENKPLWKYLREKWIKYEIYKIEDPADKSKKFKEEVIKKIYNFIKDNYEEFRNS